MFKMMIDIFTALYGDVALVGTGRDLSLRCLKTNLNAYPYPAVIN